MLDHGIGRRNSLTALLLPLANRCLLLPNVAVAELIDYAPGQRSDEAPEGYLGTIGWRHLDVPLLSLEVASGGPRVVGPRARIAVLNAIGETPLRFFALLIQDIPRSCKIDSQLSYVDVPLAPLELAAVQVGDKVARVPDMPALERLASAYGLSAS